MAMRTKSVGVWLTACALLVGVACGRDAAKEHRRWLERTFANEAEATWVEIEGFKERLAKDLQEEALTREEFMALTQELVRAMTPGVCRRLADSEAEEACRRAAGLEP